MRYADRAQGGQGPCFMRSWRYRSRRSARRSRQDAAGGSSVDTDTAAPVDCGNFLAALTERLFRYPASSHRQAFLFTLSSNATGFDQDTQLALLQSAPSTIICWRSAFRLRLLHAYRRMHTPSSCHPHACCACPSAAHVCARKTPLIRASCADAVAALPHALSDCACLPAVPDKPRP